MAPTSEEVIFTDHGHDVCSFLFAVRGHFASDGNGAGAQLTLRHEPRALLFTRLLCGQMTMEPVRVPLPTCITVPSDACFTPLSVFMGYATPQVETLVLPLAGEATRIDCHGRG